MTSGVVKKRSATIGEVAAKAAADLQNLTVQELTALKRFRELQQQIRDQIRRALGDRHLFSRAEVADLFDVSVRTVNRWVARGELPKPRHGKWDIREIIQFLRARIEEKEKRSDLTPEERYRLAKAEREELRLARERGEVVAREAVIREAAPLLNALRSAVLGLPERILHYVPEGQRREVRAELQEICEGHVRELREIFLDGTHKRSE